MDSNQIAALVTASINAGSQLLELWLKVANDLKQNTELTTDQEKSLDDAIAILKNKPWWTPDAP